MNCPKCGSPLSGGSVFCLNCGQMFAATPGGGAIAVAKTKNAPLVIGSIAVGVLGLFVALTAAGVLRFGAKSPQAAVRVQADPAGVTLTQRNTPDNSVVTVPGQSIEMPDAIRKWLEHLERMEQKKNELHLDMTSEARIMERMMGAASGLEGMDVSTILDPEQGMPDPRNNVAKMFEEMSQPWRDLRSEFLTTGPPMPPECAPLAKAFEDGLAAIPEQIDALTNIMGSFDPAAENVRDEAKGAERSARDIGRNHKRPVDASFAKADVLLEDICRKYRTDKWFDIDTGTMRGGPFSR